MVKRLQRWFPGPLSRAARGWETMASSCCTPHHPLQHTHYTATYTQKYSTEKKHKIRSQLHKTHKNTQSTAQKWKTRNRHTYPTFLLLQLDLTFMKRILRLVPVKKIIFKSPYDWPSVETVLRCSIRSQTFFCTKMKF